MAGREPTWACATRRLLGPAGDLALAEQPAGLASEIADRPLGALTRATHRPGRYLRPPSRAQQHECRARGAADEERRGGARPVAGVAHPGQLPRLQLLRGPLREARDRILPPLHAAPAQLA